MKAWQILSSSEKWTRGALARDKHGQAVAIIDPAATCFCASGAIIKAYGHGTTRCHDAFSDVGEYIHLKTQFSGIPGWNDHTGQRWEEVHAVLKKLNV